jgi:hypothetical protein
MMASDSSILRLTATFGVSSPLYNPAKDLSVSSMADFDSGVMKAFQTSQ